MELKYSSKYITISVDKEKKYIETRKTTLTETQSDEEYKTDILNWAKTVVQLEELSYQLMDEQNMRYLIVPQMQTWVNEVLVVPSVKRGLRRVAILVPNDLFAKVAIKQIVTKVADKEVVVKYFQEEKTAKEWLFDEDSKNIMYT